MSVDDNKPIIKKSREILKDLGYDVKPSHLYEMYSKLSGFRDWNTASAKQVDFKNVLNDAAFNKVESSLKNSSDPYVSLANLDFPAFKKEIEKLMGSKKWFLGYDADTHLPIIVDGEEFPNTFSAGHDYEEVAKSIESMILMWLVGSQKNSIVFWIKSPENKSEAPLLGSDGVMTIEPKKEKILEIINLLYAELDARAHAFTELGVKTLVDYEAQSKKSVTRIMFYVEGFSEFIEALNYDEKHSLMETPAYKFKQILKFGRDFGISSAVATQKATKSDIPSEIVSNFTQKQIFRVSSREASYFLPDDAPSNYSQDQRSTAMVSFENSDARIRFPWYEPDVQAKLLKMFEGKGKASLMHITKEILNMYLFANVKEIKKNFLKMEDLFETSLKSSSSSISGESFLKQFYTRQGYSVTPLEEYFDYYLIEKSGDKKVSLLRHGSSSLNLTQKHLDLISKFMNKYEAKQGEILCFSNSISNSFRMSASTHSVNVLDLEDILNEAKIMDRENK